MILIAQPVSAILITAAQSHFILIVASLYLLTVNGRAGVEKMTQHHRPRQIAAWIGSANAAFHKVSAQCRRRSVEAGGSEKSPRITSCVFTSVTTGRVGEKCGKPSKWVKGVKSFTEFDLGSCAVVFGWQCRHE
jgi:hypothetical protein